MAACGAARRQLGGPGWPPLPDAGTISSMTLTELRAAIENLSYSILVARHPYPFLLVARIEPVLENKHSFETLHARLMGDETPPADTIVWPITRAGSAGALMITVGRTKNSDIVLASPGISKLHGYFQRDLATQSYSIADAGSRNGTTLNGRQLKPKIAAPISDGDVLEFGRSFRGSFYTAAALQAALPALLAASGIGAR
jgi:hypothetical protein